MTERRWSGSDEHRHRQQSRWIPAPHYRGEAWSDRRRVVSPGSSGGGDGGGGERARERAMGLPSLIQRWGMPGMPPFRTEANVGGRGRYARYAPHEYRRPEPGTVQGRRGGGRGSGGERGHILLQRERCFLVSALVGCWFFSSCSCGAGRKRGERVQHRGKIGQVRAGNSTWLAFALWCLLD